jgi:hypothetical protein
MIIAGLQHCESCKELKKKYPDFRYVEILRKSGHSFNSNSILKIKSLIGKKGLDQFPILIDDNMETIISIKEFDPEFAKDYPKLF